MIYRITESSAWVGVSLALFFAPMLLVGVPAGAIADRFNKRSVLIVTEVALLLLLGAFAWCLTSGLVGVAGALVMSTLSGTLRSIHQPARLSYAGEIAGQRGLVAALSMLSISTRFGQLLGAVSAGFISEKYGPGMAYAVLAAGHAIATLAFAKTAIRQTTLPTPQSTVPAKKANLFGDSVEYLSAMRSHSILLILIVLASAVEVLGFSFATALPEIAIDRLNVSDGGLGTMHSMRATGGLIGAVVLSLLVVRNIGSLFLVTIVGFACALITLAVAPDFNRVLLAIGVIALFASWADILTQGMLQISAPAALRGRAMGAWVFALGMGPLGHIELGILMSLIGTTAALTINAVALLLVGIAAFIWLPSVRNLRNQQDY